VAAQEGLSGGIGDAGTSFGPFQLHKGGALPRGIANPHAWAWSRPGLLYALSRIKRVAGRRQGADAITNIVRQFERPANPENEIAKALGYYRRNGGGVATPSPFESGTAPAGDTNRQMLVDAILNDQSLIPYIQAQRAGGSVSEASLPMVQAPALNRSLPAELIYKNHFLKNGQAVKPIGGHETHVHVSETDPQAMLAAIALARRIGLKVGENPYVGRVYPVHAPHSYHKRTFPGKYNGRRLGEAIDVTGSPKLLQRYYSLLAGGR